MSHAHAASAEDHHPPGLAHHFESYEQQKESSFLGMWAFLAQELMFFGGLFTCYIIYRSMHGDAFLLGSAELDWRIGAFNTAVLLGSSFTMVVAVWAAQIGKPKAIFWGLIGTIVLGGVFLGVKVIEYASKYEHHLIPGLNFEWTGPPASGIEIFFALYFAMTGMHALHMIIGMVIMLFMLKPALNGHWTPQNHNFVEGFGLYWHFVDIVWIFLFPFLYLLNTGAAAH
ncbi:MAG: cytochrome c oxidase subunit 3 family protein [Acidobacteriota bacterium]